MCAKIFQYSLLSLVVLIALKNCAANYEILKYLQKPNGNLKIHNRKETHQRVLDMSYPCEKHNIQTEDGYIISIFHIPYSSKADKRPYTGRKRPTVLLQHGLLSTSDGWILNGPENSLPFMLADQGFDVWLGNARGNLYGRKHTNLTTAHSKFWRFSWHEIGYYDLAATIDYILANDRNTDSIHYIGYSQGCTILMVLLSLRAEYQEKLKTINFLAPAIFLTNTKDPLFKMLAGYMGEWNIITQGFSSREFMPYNELYSLLAYNACKKDAIFQGFCSSIAFMMEGFSQHKNESAMHILMETHPGGISTDQIIHFTQTYNARSFRQYDFGFAKNLLYYNQSQPPDYPLKNIRQNFHIWYGLGDRLTSWKDILQFADILANVVLHRIPADSWSHGDFLFSLDSKFYINEPILNNLLEYEKKISFSVN